MLAFKNTTYYFRLGINFFTFGISAATSNLTDNANTTLWKWTEDGKLMNKEKEFSWKYGQKKWSRVNNFIVDDETGKVLGAKYLVFVSSRSVKTENL